MDDQNVEDIVVLNLQRAVQLAIDIAATVVSNKKLGVPNALKESFFILYQSKIIDKELSDKMGRMVGFRNIAVHNYQSIDSDILRAVVKNHLKDIEDFYTAVLNNI